MQPAFLLLFFLLLTAERGWGICDHGAKESGQEGIAEKACESSVQSLREWGREEVEGVYVLEDRMRVYLSDELLRDLMKEDCRKDCRRHRWIQSLRHEVQWQSLIEVCSTDGSSEDFPWTGSRLRFGNTLDGTRIVEISDFPVDCSITDN